MKYNLHLVNRTEFHNYTDNVGEYISAYIQVHLRPRYD